MNLDKKMFKSLEEIKKISSIEDKQNILFTGRVYVVLGRSFDENLKDESDFDGVKLVINDSEYDDLSWLKKLLKQNVFDVFLSKEKYNEAKKALFIDNNGDLLSMCEKKPLLFNEAKNLLLKEFKKIDNFISFNEVLSYLKSWYEYNLDLVEMEDFPKNLDVYKIVKYKKQFVPYSVFTVKKDANKYARTLIKNGIESKVESISTKDGKSSLSVVFSYLKKMMEEAL